MLSMHKHWWGGCFCLLLLLMGLVDARLHAQSNQPNLPVLQPAPQHRGYPDTLLMGGYLLLVEAYDTGGTYDQPSGSYIGLNGLARMQFGCGGPVIINPLPIFTDAGTPDASPQSEAAIAGAAMGGQNALLLGSSALMNAQLKAPLVSGGIRVRFKNLTVKVTAPNVTKGTVTAGAAAYPSEVPLPVAPFNLPVASGFELKVSAFTLHPVNGVTVSAKLKLPSSLSSPDSCDGALLNLGKVAITPYCEFYKEYLTSDYGLFNIGSTTLAVRGQGFVVDFSTTQAYAPSGKANFWKGVALLQGESPGTPGDSVLSNIGYLQARYAYTQALVETNGFTANLTNNTPYSYTTAQPMGYTIKFQSANLTVFNSGIPHGSILNAFVTLPRTAVRQANDSTVQLQQANLNVHPSLNLTGVGVLPANTSLYWGDFVKAGGDFRKSFGVENIPSDVLLYFSAAARDPFLPIDAAGKTFKTPFTTLSLAALDSFGIQGATFKQFNGLVVNTPDIPGDWKPNDPAIPWSSTPIHFLLSGNQQRWLNVVTEGVHCSLAAEVRDKAAGYQLGDTAQPLYVGITPFETLRPDRNVSISINVQCVESAVIHCDFRSSLLLAAPTGDTIAFTNMVFTSTANNAGGKLSIGTDDSLAYWGLKLVPKPGFSSAGLVSVKTGQIILTAAGLAEEKHFAQPFWITWGEILANGSVGRLFFDFNSAGQQFDAFPFVHSAVALSPYSTAASVKPFLRVGGMIHFPFFGGDYLHIKDFYEPTLTAHPYDKRSIALSNESFGNFLSTDRSISGNWSDGLGIFDFNLDYASQAQDGFIGTGTSVLRNLLGGAIGSTLEMNRRGTCIRIGTNLLDQRSVHLGPVASITELTRIWGCVCIKNDGIENMVVGGEVAQATNVSIAARQGSYLSAVMQITPSLAKLTIDGMAYLSLAASLDVEVNGHMQLTMNFAEGFLEGEVSGKFRTAVGVAGPPAEVAGGSLEAKGQLNWHLGADFQEIQGAVELQVMGMAMTAGAAVGVSTGIGAGFYVGVNAPKSRAWILIGNDPRYNLNMMAMPNKLTGVYGFLHVQQGINLFVISGGYEFFVGLGAFVEPPAMTPVVVGNLGGRIHGEILGGLVSAAAYFNLQLILGVPRFGFEGTVGLEACVLWVFCGSVDITMGLNSEEGFYIR